MALLEMTFFAETLQRFTDVTVIIPVENTGILKRKKPEHFPTLYLLHGYTGNSKDWLSYANVRTIAEECNLAVVMPSGENGFYVDNEKLEIYNGKFIKELVDYTRRIFPLSSNREDTFIGGLSMGGFGAMRNGAAYADVFSKIFSLSGAFILDDILEKKTNLTVGQGYYDRVFGSRDSVKAGNSNPIVCFEKAKERGNVPEIYMACGTEDFLIEHNRKTKEILNGMGISPVYCEAEGIHDWKFWNTWLPKAVEWLMS